MYIFCSLSWCSLSFMRGSYFHKKLRKGKFQFWWLRHKMKCWQFLTDFFNFDNIVLSLILEKTFLLGVIVSVNRRNKDIKVTFLSFGLHTGRFNIECTEYGSTLFSYFEIFIYVSSNFTLDWRITEYLRCHIGL